LPNVTYHIETLTGKADPNDKSNSRVDIQLFGKDGSFTSLENLNTAKDERELGQVDHFDFSMKSIGDLGRISLAITGKDRWCYDWVSVRCEECGWSCNATRAPLPCLDDNLTNNHTEFTCENLIKGECTDEVDECAALAIAGECDEGDNRKRCCRSCGTCGLCSEAGMAQCHTECKEKEGKDRMDCMDDCCSDNIECNIQGPMPGQCQVNGAEYTDCTCDGTPATCDNPGGACSRMCGIPGCQCPDGTVLHEGECIAPLECPNPHPILLCYKECKGKPVGKEYLGCMNGCIQDEKVPTATAEVSITNRADLEKQQAKAGKKSVVIQCSVSVSYKGKGIKLANRKDPNTVEWSRVVKGQSASEKIVEGGKGAKLVRTSFKKGTYRLYYKEMLPADSGSYRCKFSQGGVEAHADLDINIV